MKLGIFSSLKDKAAYDLLEGILGAIDAGFLSGIKVKYVFCDRPELVKSSLKKALKNRNIALFTKSSGELRKTISQSAGDEKAVARSRDEFDRGVFGIISKCETDFVLLAGYMLIMSSFLCGKLKMINLHPDLPGRLVGTWRDIMRQISEQKLKLGGAMLHIATKHLDEGPVLSYFIFPVSVPDPEKIRSEEFRRELPLILLTLKALGEGEITFQDGEVYTRGKKGALDLSKEVENFRL